MRKYERRDTWQEELKKILDQMVKENEEFNSQMELILEMMEDAYNNTRKYL